MNAESRMSRVIVAGWLVLQGGWEGEGSDNVMIEQGAYPGKAMVIKPPAPVIMVVKMMSTP